MSSLDDLVTSALDRVRVAVSGQLEADLAASASDIRRAASEAAARAAEEAAERAAADVRSEAELQLAAVRDDLERQRDEIRAVSAAELATLQRALEEERERVAGARRDAEEERERVAGAQREVEEGRQGREVLDRQLEELRRELEDHARASDELRRQLDEVQRRMEEAGRDAERAAQERESIRGELEVARDALTQADRLTEGFRALDTAETLGDVLDGLTRQARLASGRTAVFLLNSDRLRAWRATGFDDVEAVTGVDLHVDEAGVVGDAARSGAGQISRNGSGMALPVFATGHDPRHALAMPIEVGGSVIAVLYADKAETETPEDPRWTDHIELMARHAGRVLEALTVRQAASLSTRRAPLGRVPSRRGGA